jgi:AcrR family transcriptional regulator
MSTRRYTKRVRAEKESETRSRIVDAVLALWAEAGPLATTISAVAGRAGVQRLTVYRHFDDDARLFAAAGEAFARAHPWPDPADWATTGHAAKRLRRALDALYAYYESAGDTLTNLLRDGSRVPALVDTIGMWGRYLEGVIATLEPGWIARGGDAALLDAALEHAVQHSTWRSLAQHGLERTAIVRFIEQSVRAVGRRSKK